MASLTPWSVAADRDARLSEATKRVTQRRSVRVADRDVVEPGRPRRRRGGTAALPGVEAEVMVVAAGADERRLVSVALGDVEAEHVAVKTERLVDVGHLQMNVPNVHTRIDPSGHPPSLRAGAQAWHSRPRIALRAPGPRTVQCGKTERGECREQCLHAAGHEHLPPQSQVQTN